jgi:uncharacterized protein YcbK (DUF882 family)
MLRYFDMSEFDCSETGENKMDQSFLAELDELRNVCGFAFVVNSGYRSPLHSIEAAKPKPGMHTLGVAADIAVADGRNRYTLVSNAMQMGFSGIGIAKSYVHLDMRFSDEVMWVYD